MLRLTIFLCAGMLAALMIAGEDRGQMRPGLAKAALTPEPVAPPPVEEAAPVLAETPAPAPAIPETAEVVAEPLVQPEAAAPRDVVQVVQEPVFTLSVLGNELVPGEDGTPASGTASLDVADPATPAPEASGGEIRFVTASSVNVRASPSTDAAILGKLQTGEATLVLAEVDAEWARIVIEGDGIEGYVALRFLSPEAP